MSGADLSGGEIKNAVVVAVTEAIGRSPRILIMADLVAGIRAARAGRFNEDAKPAIGFAPRDAGGAIR